VRLALWAPYRGGWPGRIGRLLMNEILVPMAPADLIDRLIILRLRSAQARGPAEQSGIVCQIARLQDIADQTLPMNDALQAQWDALRDVNADLLVIEGDLRRFEGRADFGPAFVALVRAILVTRDDRKRIKMQINVLLGAAAVVC